MYPINKSQGGALLTALFIMTLVAIVATAMSTRLQLDIYRTRLIIQHDKLYLASQAVTFWSLSELNNSKNKFTKSNAQGMVASYPRNMDSIYNQVNLSGELYDLQSRFNLNNLVEKKYTLPFINLIGNVYPDANNKDKINIVEALKNWLMTYDLSRGKDSYTSYYHAQNPPYNPSHQLIKSTSELRLIKDISATFYLAMQPYITALPETTAININTAPKKILMSLGNGLKESKADELIMARGENGIADLKDINELIQKIDLPTEQITLESNYFLSVAVAKSDELNLVIYTLIHRSKDKKGNISVNIIRESINTF
ncbi:type II secretion system minor pseudopilin GspK [uncultured Legionella sp.]|uniref:type II secretion system minor pseudopilin GspK n=1 Tax=uncultured Legionella sp. TaxID=210934 RepID=UPI002619AA21|nr:type II secretion system minor pseudopilin GspK [uncultured Legionella sp.]